MANPLNMTFMTGSAVVRSRRSSQEAPRTPWTTPRPGGFVSGPFAVPLPVDLAAVAVGSVQGAVFATRMARERHIDIIGIVVIGIATGVGGGMIRDLLLEQPVAALASNRYLVTAALAALAGMIFADLVNRMEIVVVAIDAASLGLWAVVGTYKASGFGFGVVPSAFVGVIACVGGTTFLAVDQIADSLTAASAAILVTFGLRMLAYFFGWRTPRSRTLNLPPKGSKDLRGSR